MSGTEPTAGTRSEAPTTVAFSGRVLVFFLAEVLGTALVLFTGFYLAAQIGPSGKGQYYLVTFLPTTLLVISQFGLPQALSFFSARGLTNGIVTRSVVLSALASGSILLITLALLPVLQATILRGIEPIIAVVPLLVLPFLLNSTLTTGIVVGRQSAVGLGIVKTVANLAAALLMVGLVGVLGLGVWGAVVAFLIAGVVLAGGLLGWARAVTARVAASGSASYRELVRYGLQLYPGNLAQFLAHRVDIFLLAWLIADAAAPLGYYSMAVAMAEIILLLPGSVSAFFLPHVAGLTRDVSDRQVAVVSRVTLLLTAAAALAVVPVAVLSIRVLLPAFEPSLPALYILLPGVVVIAVSQVLAGYIAGLGRPGVTSKVGVMTLVVNVALNLVLIPPLGILGASAASLLAYTLSSVVYSVIAARLTGHSPADFWIPRLSDVRFVVERAMTLLRLAVRR